jgi:hypothetical protein
MILGTRKAGSERVLHAVAGEELVGSIECPRFEDLGRQRCVDVVACAPGDHGDPQRGCDRHGVAASVRGCRTDRLETLCVFLRPVRKRRKPGVSKAPCGTQHSRAVGGDPDFRPLPLVRRKVEQRVAQREVGRVAVNQLSARVPQRSNSGHRFLEPGDGLGPLNPVWLVAFTFTSADAEYRPSVSQQMERRCGLRSDSRIAPTGVCHTGAEAQTTNAIAGRKMPEHGPRLQNRVHGRDDSGATAVLLLPNRARKQRVEMVRHPE